MLLPHSPALMLAPMQGVVDAPMRATLAEMGCLTACVAEYVRVSALVPPPGAFYKLVPELLEDGRTRRETPVIVQLLGGDPQRLALSAQLACELGAVAIDLNFGCPANTVNRHDGGAALLKEPQRIFEIVRAVRQSTPSQTPVSAKVRLGWDSADALEETSAAAAEGGASWLTIHGRTRVQGYNPYALWQPIGKIRQQLKIPVVANGDIFDVSALKRCLEETGCVHVMVGRGAIANPFALVAMAHHLGLKGIAPIKEGQPYVTLMQRYVVTAKQMAPDQAEQFLPGRLKQWCLLAKRHNAMPYYDNIKRLTSSDAILQTISAMG